MDEEELITFKEDKLLLIINQILAKSSSTLKIEFDSIS